MPSNQEFYNQWVKPQFDTISNKQDEIIRLLRGHNSDPGLVDEVRDNTRFRRKVAGGIKWFVVTVGAAIIGTVAWIVKGRFGG